MVEGRVVADALVGSIPTSLMVVGNYLRSFIVRIDMGLTNETLWAGCKIVQIGGRANLVTAPKIAMEIMAANLNKSIALATDRSEVTLTGPMAVWAYLVAFHLVVHKFTKIYYDDGKSGPLLVAQHGA